MVEEEKVDQYNIAMIVSYHGLNYSGFQSQDHSRTVQGELEKAISKVANETVTTSCAGRTDAGVHGTNQVINFTTRAKRAKKSWIMGVNSNLPKDIRVKEVYEVDAGFNSRFSAIARRYRYILKISLDKITDAHLQNLVTTIDFDLDLDRMNEACQYLLGEHDFKSFQASQCQAKTSSRFIHHAHFKRFHNLVVFDIKANAFLYHMVRNIMGTMLKVGKGELAPEDVQKLIEAKDRKLAPPTAPANGLYLIAVDYNDQYKYIVPKDLGPLFLPDTL